jgi:molybdate transport system substrate-binding protein
MKSHTLRPFLLMAALLLPLQASSAGEVRVLTAGAFKQVVLALVPDFEKQTGSKVIVDNDTAGGLQKRIEGGEAFDVAVITPAIVDDLAGKGKIAPGSRANLATVGIGVMVKEGAPKPDVSTVEAFKNALLAAKTVAYIEPASGGSSGIYLDKLLERLGIADQVWPKAKLKKGGYVADLIVSGEAELGVHQISEIVPVKGRRARGALAEGNPEHHDLCRRPKRFASRQGGGAGVDQDVFRTGSCGGAEIQRHGSRKIRIAQFGFGRRRALA